MEFVEKVKIKELAEHFKFERIVGNDESLERWVVVPDLNRPGLELAGFIDTVEPRRILLIGDKEYEYINTLSEDIQRSRFEAIMDGYTPAAIIANGRDCPEILRSVAESRNFPVFKTTEPTYRVMANVIAFLDTKLAPTDSVHAVLINVYGKGVLIRGGSGLGKSEIALELLRRGHVLVADDAVDICRISDRLVGSAPAVLKDFLEIRGLGVINVQKMFGGASVLDSSDIHLVVNLEEYNTCKDYDRIGGDEETFTELLGIKVPEVTLPVKEGRSMGVIIEAVVTNFRLKETGYSSSDEFKERTLKLIERNRLDNDN